MRRLGLCRYSRNVRRKNSGLFQFAARVGYVHAFAASCGQGVGFTSDTACGSDPPPPCASCPRSSSRTAPSCLSCLMKGGGPDPGTWRPPAAQAGSGRPGRRPAGAAPVWDREPRATRRVRAWRRRVERHLADLVTLARHAQRPGRVIRVEREAGELRPPERAGVQDHECCGIPAAVRPRILSTDTEEARQLAWAERPASERSRTAHRLDVGGAMVRLRVDEAEPPARLERPAERRGDLVGAGRRVPLGEHGTDGLGAGSAAGARPASRRCGGHSR